MDTVRVVVETVDGDVVCSSEMVCAERANSVVAYLRSSSRVRNVMVTPVPLELEVSEAINAILA